MRGRLLLAVVAVLALGGGVAAVRAGDGDAQPGAREQAPAPRAPTPRAALNAVRAAAVRRHLVRLAAIAERADGTRAAGTPGDRATRAYVAGRLRAAGWRVTLEPVAYPFFAERRDPRVAPLGGRALVARRDMLTMAYSPGATVTGRVRVVGLAPGRASDAACGRADLRRVRRGDVAVIQRGTCTLRQKAMNAQAAGAAAALIVNDGVDGRTDAYPGTLGSPGLHIPVLALSTDAGRRVAAARRVRVDVRARSERRRTANVLAEIGRGAQVAMAGAHLDSVPVGPGMNDDGSGVAALLALADVVRAAPEGGRIALGFWAAEELGLYGSRRHVARLDGAARRAIAAYVNLDMVGSPGGTPVVYAGDARARRLLAAGLRARGRTRIGTEPLRPNSDHASFERAGIPVGGIFTGLDRCYHRRCDRLGNVDARLAADAAGATAAALLRLAR